MAEMDLREEVRVAWGTGIAGYVAESGEPVNIPDAYQVNADECLILYIIKLEFRESIFILICVSKNIDNSLQGC